MLLKKKKKQEVFWRGRCKRINEGGMARSLEKNRGKGCRWWRGGLSFVDTGRMKRKATSPGKLTHTNSQQR